MIYVVVILLAYIAIFLTLKLDEHKHKTESIRVYLSDILMLTKQDSENIKKIVENDSNKSLIKFNYELINEFEKINFNLKELNKKLKTVDYEDVASDTRDIRLKLFDIENNLERINIALKYLDEKN